MCVCLKMERWSASNVSSRNKQYVLYLASGGHPESSESHCLCRLSDITILEQTRTDAHTGSSSAPHESRGGRERGENRPCNKPNAIIFHNKT